jgi:asparagine synthase (glutamine-hydrolysing)
MCGFISVFHPDHKFDLDLIKKMNDDIHHRGPDDSCIVIKQKFSLGFRRLSIIDPTKESNQPFFDHSKNFIIIFNGEIYNYKFLKDKLEHENVKFYSKGDTEVFLNGYIKWGEAIFNLVEGMFAAVIIDQNKQQAIAIRDQLGIKPLYYSNYNNNIAFSSELRPLRRIAPNDLEAKDIGELLVFRFNSGQNTGFKYIKKLEAGHLIRLNYKNNTFTKEEYYNLNKSFKINNKITYEDALQITEDALKNSVKQHLVSDVGYSFQLSGGVDSSLICALAATESSKKVNSYSIRINDKKNDESKWRKKVVEKYDLNHQEIDFSFEDYADFLPTAIKKMEAPIPHNGCPFLMLLYERVGKSNKVMLTGEGADELFGGYMRYKDWKRLKNYHFFGSLIPTWIWKFLKRYEGIRRYSDRDPAIWSSVIHQYLEIENRFPEISIDGSLRYNLSKDTKDIRQRMLLIDQKVYLESLLFRQDKMSMASSVEARVPFAHLPLYKAINEIPLSIKITGKETKPLLKRIAEKYLDHENVNRRKNGLTIPLDRMLKNPRSLGKYLELFNKNSLISNFIEYKEIDKLINDYRKNKYNDHSGIMNFINVELWLQSIKEN